MIFMVMQGVYLLGYFEKGKQGRFMFSHRKPFKIDIKTGEVTPICFRVFGGSVCWTDWHYFEGHKLHDFNSDNVLRKECNIIWAEWCTKHRCKVKPLLLID